MAHSHSPSHSPASPVPGRLSWWERLGEWCFEASAPHVVRSMAFECGDAYRKIIGNLAMPLAPAIEREVARTLNRDLEHSLIPARTLLPAMMQRFGIDAASGPLERKTLQAMERTCNRCPEVGRCWLAMRHHVPAEACRGFCPNAEALERVAIMAD